MWLSLICVLLEDSSTFGIDWDAPIAVPDAIHEVLVPEAPPALQDVIETNH